MITNKPTKVHFVVSVIACVQLKSAVDAHKMPRKLNCDNLISRLQNSLGSLKMVT